METDRDFESFWRHFLADHPSPANRWAHVAALVAGVGGAVLAVRRRSLAPALAGAALASALAGGGHPVFQGDRPQNFGKPLWAARAFLRLCARTVTGRAAEELAEIQAAAERDAASSADEPPPSGPRTPPGAGRG
jgi:hypothetical protein